ILRQCWDGESLRVMTKTDPMVAEDVHVGILGHITVAELRAELRSTEAANGFANRFLWIAVRRSQHLPDPTPLDETIARSFIEQLVRRLEHASSIGRIRRAEDARSWWNDDLYERLGVDGEADGVVGSMLARAEAHVLRLSAVYALLDGSVEVRRPHLA